MNFAGDKKEEDFKASDGVFLSAQAVILEEGCACLPCWCMFLPSGMGSLGASVVISCECREFRLELPTWSTMRTPTPEVGPPVFGGP